MAGRQLPWRGLHLLARRAPLPLTERRPGQLQQGQLVLQGQVFQGQLHQEQGQQGRLGRQQGRWSVPVGLQARACLLQVPQSRPLRRYRMPRVCA